MGFLDALLGRTKPAKANLDQLFGLPGAQITLEASEGLVATGHAGVCFKASTGPAFEETESEIAALLGLAEGNGASAPGLDASKGTATNEQATGVSVQLAKEVDEYGYTWVVLSSDDFDTLVTRAHYVNSTLQDNGYGAQLLCSVFAFARRSSPGSDLSGASTYLVYLYKRGSFYPFVPTGPERRDNEAELRLKALLADDLSIEKDLDRWFPLWKLPFH